MRLNQARIEPLPESEWSDEQRKLVQPTLDRWGLVFDVVKTLMRNMPLFSSWNRFAAHVMSTSSLSARHRELLIMRVGWRTDSEYEWGQHVLMSKPAGLTPTDHERIKAGADAAGWDALESALLRATDELLDDTMISDAVWDTLSEDLSTEQITDAIFTVGQYNMLAMAINSLGVQREPGIPGYDG